MADWLERPLMKVVVVGTNPDIADLYDFSGLFCELPSF